MTGSDGSRPNIGRSLAWPLIMGGGVLAVAWSAWEVASGKQPVDAISIAVSGLAAFGVAVICVTLTIDLLVRLGTQFTAQHPRFLSLDWMVPMSAVLGFGLGWVVWR